MRDLPTLTAECGMGWKSRLDDNASKLMVDAIPEAHASMKAGGQVRRRVSTMRCRRRLHVAKKCDLLGTTAV